MRKNRDAATDPASPVDGVSLATYVEVCQALVRTAGDSTRRIEEVLAAHDLSPERWQRITDGWSDRIHRHPRIRAEFQRLYASPPREMASGNE